MFRYENSFTMAETLAIGIFLLILGRIIKDRVPILKKYFIPAPVIGGFLFSLVTLYGHVSGTFSLTFDNGVRELLMIMFYTSIGFLASFKVLIVSGVGVLLFLFVAIVLVIIQNFVGIGLSSVFDINPLYGLAAGSVPLTGGHGTSGAFGPVLENAGASGATSVAIAAATYGLVAGCVIGGPIGKKLLSRYNLKGHSKEEFLGVSEKLKEGIISEDSLTKGGFILVLTMGVGLIIGELFSNIITIPIYLGPMFAAAIVRNILDSRNKPLPTEEISIIGNISLSVFLSLALMTLKLWELASLALPLVAILLVQTVVMGLFAYFITFKVMGKDYDAATIATGHCGFGLGATPNAMANMESFTRANGPSPKAFLVIPLVGSLFIDFVNAIIITLFVNFL